jgi:hypothetical protein
MVATNMYEKKKASDESALLCAFFVDELAVKTAARRRQGYRATAIPLSTDRGGTQPQPYPFQPTA